MSVPTAEQGSRRTSAAAYRPCCDLGIIHRVRPIHRFRGRASGLLAREAHATFEGGIDEFGVGIAVFSHDGEAAFGFVEYIPEVI